MTAYFLRRFQLFQSIFELQLPFGIIIVFNVLLGVVVHVVEHIDCPLDFLLLAKDQTFHDVRSSHYLCMEVRFHRIDVALLDAKLNLGGFERVLGLHCLIPDVWIVKVFMPPCEPNLSRGGFAALFDRPEGSRLLKLLLHLPKLLLKRPARAFEEKRFAFIC